MPKVVPELSALQVRRLKHPGHGRNAMFAVGGVAGLHLQISPSGARSWILRATVGNKRRDLGLGGYPDVSLSQARERARDAKDQIWRGIDPAAARRTARAALAAERARGMSFSDALAAYSAAKLSELKADSDRVRWRSSIERHALPYIGNILVGELTAQDILRVMEPIWEEKTETAKRVRSRIEAILSWATVAGYRTGDNPARWRGNIATLLPKAKKTNGKNHHPAVSLSDAQGWFAALRERKGRAARAMEFLTLCASRSGEVRGMVWSEIDFRSNVWTVPAERMKAEREHRVPLSEAAIKILEEQPRLNDTPLVFPGSKGQMSDMTLSAVMRRMHETAISDAEEAGQDTETAGWRDPRSSRRAVPHGLRSTFRDWSAEMTEYPREMAEIALAHQVGSEVERAYRRGDMLEKRRGMMNDWAKFLKGEMDELG